MQPKVGPVRFRVTEVETSIGVGASVGPVRFRWPRPLFVVSMLLLPRSGSRVDMAALRIAIEDETQQQIISSGDGSTNEAGALGLTGLNPINGPMFSNLVLGRPFALQRPVNTGDLWLITIRNVDGAGAITPELVFDIEDGVTR